MIMLFFFLNWRLDAQVVLQYSTEMFKDRKKKERERERENERGNGLQYNQLINCNEL